MSTRIVIIRRLPRSAKSVRLELVNDRATVTDAETRDSRGSYQWTGSALTGSGSLSEAQREFLAGQILDAMVVA